ncbi:LptF/LptG family permease [Spirochaetia bacterium 38H-sp]|uniref:LptF/LptG family permease n=1 Tax=Rarispira pelagica TaxID=3141764 RepID=A0ABU9UCB1_9SPIR
MIKNNSQEAKLLLQEITDLIIIEENKGLPFRQEGLLIMRKRYFILFKYIAQEVGFSFLIAFLFFFFILLINQFLYLAERILSKHASPIDVIMLIIYSLPSVIAIAVPFSSLSGAIMGISRLSSDNEFIALQAGGISLYTAYVPVIVLSILLSGVSFVANDYFLPLGNINFSKLYRKILYSTPEIELESYSIKKYKNTIIIPGSVKDKNIDNFIIIEKNNEGKEIIHAQKAQLMMGKDSRTLLSLDMSDTFISNIKKNRGDYEYSFADSLIYSIYMKDININLQNTGPEKMSSLDVYRAIEEKEKKLQEKLASRKIEIEKLKNKINNQYFSLVLAENPVTKYSSLATSYNQYENLNNLPTTDRSLQRYLLEFHKKFAIPFICIPFSLLAVALGLFNIRGGRGVGFLIGVVLSIIYWSLLFVGNTLGIRTDLSPVFAMWFPDIFIFMIAFILFLLKGRG